MRIRKAAGIICLVLLSVTLWSYVRVSLTPGLEPYGDAIGYQIGASVTADLESIIRSAGPGWFAGLDVAFASAGYSNLTFYHMGGGIVAGYQFPVLRNLINVSPSVVLGAGYYGFLDVATNVVRAGFLVKPAVQMEFLVAPQFSVAFDVAARFTLIPLLTELYSPTAFILSLNLSYYFLPSASQRFVKELETIMKDEKIQGTVRQDPGNEINLNLPDVLFEPGKDAVSGRYVNAIKAIASKVRPNRSLTIMVEGHTDNVGEDAYNVALSTQRAKNVAALFEGNGVESSRISFRGWGKDKPIAPNTTESNRAKNRRVEIRFIWK